MSNKLGFPIEWRAQKIAKKQARAKFTTTWSLVVVEMGDHFHLDFQTSHGGEFGLHNMGSTISKAIGTN
jgi:hypothetical protein